jgi:mRNA-degrading endonuclease RelE of RelBE toxin-antitoxin system
MFYTIYMVTNTINDKIYIGKHQTNKVDDDYYGSGKGIIAAIKKYGKENFRKTVLHIFDTEEEMNNKEKELVTEEFLSRMDTYNAGVGGEGGPHFKGKRHSKDTKLRISKSVKNSTRVISKETRRIYSENMIKMNKDPKIIKKRRNNTDYSKRKKFDNPQKGKVTCIDKNCNTVFIDSAVYKSQVGDSRDWDFVAMRSCEGKRRLDLRSCHLTTE